MLPSTSAGGLYFDKHTPSREEGISADRQKYEKGEKEDKYSRREKFRAARKV
jgi:hypothetical protein